MTKYVYDFSEGKRDMKDLLGGKGANLAEMTNMGLPVPPGFTITTEACLSFLAQGGAPPEMSEEAAAKYGLTPIARIHTATVVGADPVIMLTAPIPATVAALEKSGLTVDDIGVFEVNEAFAPVPLAWLKEIGADPERLNPNGGAIALGHPLGGSGGRILTDMVHHMRRNKIRYGLQTMCEGGGQANATILELVGN